MMNACPLTNDLSVKFMITVNLYKQRATQVTATRALRTVKYMKTTQAVPQSHIHVANIPQSHIHVANIYYSTLMLNIDKREST